MEAVRAFIAVDIGDEIRDKLNELQRMLKKVHANVRWIKPCNMHLTLTFIGDIPIAQIDLAKSALDRACDEPSPFNLTVAGTGFFGKRRHPHVIWAGLGGSTSLKNLQKRIAQGLQEAGIDFDDKPFSPHLTLGRVKGIDQHTEPLLRKLETFSDTELGHAAIDHVDLIQSTLTPHGAHYSVLHRTTLA